MKRAPSVHHAMAATGGHGRVDGKEMRAGRRAGRWRMMGEDSALAFRRGVEASAAGGAAAQVLVRFGCRDASVMNGLLQQPSAADVTARPAAHRGVHSSCLWHYLAMWAGAGPFRCAWLCGRAGVWCAAANLIGSCSSSSFLTAEAERS